MAEQEGLEVQLAQLKEELEHWKAKYEEAVRDREEMEAKLKALSIPVEDIKETPVDMDIDAQSVSVESPVSLRKGPPPPVPVRGAQMSLSVASEGEQKSDETVPTQSAAPAGILMNSFHLMPCRCCFFLELRSIVFYDYYSLLLCFALLLFLSSCRAPRQSTTIQTSSARCWTTSSWYLYSSSSPSLSYYQCELLLFV